MQAGLFTPQPITLALADADVVYYPDFIDQPEVIYQCLKDELTWQQDSIQMYGRSVPIPRLNAWYGDAGAAYSYSGIALAPKPWSSTLIALKAELQQLLKIGFNSVLANWYRNGNDSVAWHSDDEPELGVNPVIASLSFGATRRFSLRHRNNKQIKPVHIDLEAGSLLVMAGTTQRYWQHQLTKTKSCQAGRINLTFRTIV